MKRLLILAMLVAPQAHALYKCKDERGVTHIGDTPPAACASVVMYEVTRSGTILRKIDPTPTEDQIKARQAEAERERRAKVIHASGELEASEKLLEAAERLAQQPAAIQLRYLQTLTQIAGDKSSTIVFPLPVDMLNVLAEGRGKTD